MVARCAGNVPAARQDRIPEKEPSEFLDGRSRGRFCRILRPDWTRRLNHESYCERGNETEENDANLHGMTPFFRSWCTSAPGGRRTRSEKSIQSRITDWGRPGCKRNITNPAFLIRAVSDLIRTVIDRPYMLNIQGFGLPTPTPTPTVGAVYDCTISDLIRAVSDLIRTVIDRPYMLNIQGFGHPVPTPTVGAVYDCTISDLIRTVIDRPYMLNVGSSAIPRYSVTFPHATMGSSKAGSRRTRRNSPNCG